MIPNQLRRIPRVFPVAPRVATPRHSPRQGHRKATGGAAVSDGQPAAPNRANFRCSRKLRTCEEDYRVLDARWALWNRELLVTAVLHRNQTRHGDRDPMNLEKIL